jgi:hypothetical protein
MVIQRTIVTVDRKIRIILLKEFGLFSKKIKKMTTGKSINRKFNSNVSNKRFYILSAPKTYVI